MLSRNASLTVLDIRRARCATYCAVQIAAASAMEAVVEVAGAAHHQASHITPRNCAHDVKLVCRASSDLNPNSTGAMCRFSAATKQ